MGKDPKELKSAYELAMERLEKEDAKKGRKRKPLTAGQKERIQGLREEARAKLAELEILHRDKRDELFGDPERAAELRELEEHYEADRRRVESDLEEKIARLKRE